MRKEEDDEETGTEGSSSVSEEIKTNKKKKKVKRDTIHVSTSYTMNTVDFTSKVIPSLGKQKDNSSMIATSPKRVEKKEKNMVSTNPMVMQVQMMETGKGNCDGCQELSRLVKGMKLEMEMLDAHFNVLDERIMTLDKFSLKLTHVVVLHLLQ